MSAVKDKHKSEDWNTDRLKKEDASVAVGLKNYREGESELLHPFLEHQNSQFVNEPESEQIVPPTPAFNEFQIGNTFEEHFWEPDVQRTFKMKLLMFEMWMKISFLLATLTCSIIANQKFYRENKEITRTILIVFTTVLCVLMSGLPFFISKIEKLKQYPGLIFKIIMDAILRILQAAIFSLWIDLIFLEVWIRLIDSDPTQMPFLYVIPAYYAVSLTNHLVIILILIFKKIDPSKCQSCFLCQSIIALSVVIGIDFIAKSKSKYFGWNLSQICLAAGLAEMEYLVDFCSNETCLQIPEAKSVPTSQYTSEVRADHVV